MNTPAFRPAPDAPPLNLVLIGSGHYATGQTALSGRTPTDKDTGVLLPSALFLRAQGKVGRIAVCGQDGDKLQDIQARIGHWAQDPGIDPRFEAFPGPGQHDPQAWLRALDTLPQPCAALIALPDALHAEAMLACAQRGIPFLIVKPAVTTLDDYYRVREAMPAGLLGMIDYHKVFDEANLLLLDDLRQQAYGRVHHVSSLMSQRRDMIRIYERWLRANPRCNINHYLGSHYIHMTGFLTGAVPLDVRATQQFGHIREAWGLAVADTIQTQIRWRAADGHVFASHHIAGWADPGRTESMTYQQMHLLTENGHVFSDQRLRGTRKVLEASGPQAPNPHFFNLSRSLLGGWNLTTKYGYQSVAHFVDLAAAGRGAADDLHLPTLAESEHVTAILEAADRSLARDSAVVSIVREGDRLHLI
ncbi:hypothetical protein [Pseudaquabacterium rugosum]|uniref:Gfo/Idh/MocA family oxidoreductase n=1 Tax=Pseudaquabacterium rugosum TaxID=2984194 RepID=A0ABU9B9A2_9BURK